MSRPLGLAAGLLLVAALLVFGAPAASAATCQTPFAITGFPVQNWTHINNDTIPWATTDGNVLTSEALYTPGGPYLVIGGNFTRITQPNGTVVSARNLAVLRIADGKVIWKATAMLGGWPKTIQARGGVIYVGGSFTSINGIARRAVAAFSATSYGMLPWKPTVTMGSTVRAIQVSDAGVAYVGGNSSVMAFDVHTARLLWTSHSSNGPVMTMLLSPTQEGLYVGGFFTALGGVPINELAAIYPLNAALPPVVPTFDPHLRPNTPGNDDGELPLQLAWDTSVPGQLRLAVGTGGGITNTVQEIEPTLGGKFWTYQTEGDTQGLAVVGNTLASGYHRGHGNLLGCPFAYYGTQWGLPPGFPVGFVLPWDPGLSGTPTPAGGVSGNNGGIADILTEPTTHRVFVVGDFSQWGATCNFDTITCTGGIPKRGIAVYAYSGAGT